MKKRNHRKSRGKLARDKEPAKTRKHRAANLGTTDQARNGVGPGNETENDFGQTEQGNLGTALNEIGQVPESETVSSLISRYEDLDDEVKNVELADRKDYFIIRNKLGLPEPEMLMWQDGYVPLGPSKDDPRFILRRPTDHKTGRPLSDEHEREFHYQIGKTVGKDEAHRLKIQYTETGAAGPGRPSKNKELNSLRAKIGYGIRRQSLAVTGGKKPTKLPASVPSYAASGASDDQAFEPAKDQARRQKSERPFGGLEIQQSSQKKPADLGSVELHEAAAGPAGGSKVYDGKKRPLAAWIMERVHGDATAMTRIGEIAVALVINSVKDLNGTALTAFKERANNPIQFADFITRELMQMYETMDPDVKRRMEVTEKKLSEWIMYADGIDTYYLTMLRHRQQQMDSLGRRLQIAEKMVPREMVPQYNMFASMVDEYPDKAVETAAQFSANAEIAKAAATPPPNGGSEKPDWEGLKKMKERVQGIKADFSGTPKTPPGPGLMAQLPIDADIDHFARTGQMTPGLQRKFRDYATQFVRDQQGNKGPGGVQQ